MVCIRVTPAVAKGPSGQWAPENELNGTLSMNGNELSRAVYVKINLNGNEHSRKHKHDNSS